MKLEPEKIHNRIKDLNDLIEAELDSHNDQFALNKTVLTYKNEIKKLQKQCPHEFIDGICTICGKKQN